MVFVFSAKRFDLLHEGLETGAVVDPHLAPEKIHGLNAVGALVEGHDFGIPQVLLQGIFLAEPVAPRHWMAVSQTRKPMSEQ